MQIETCEQYVLAELEYYKQRVEALEQDASAPIGSTWIVETPTEAVFLTLPDKFELPYLVDSKSEALEIAKDTEKLIEFGQKNNEWKCCSVLAIEHKTFPIKMRVFGKEYLICEEDDVAVVEPLVTSTLATECWFPADYEAPLKRWGLEELRQMLIHYSDESE